VGNTPTFAPLAIFAPRAAENVPEVEPVQTIFFPKFCNPCVPAESKYSD